MKCKDKRLTKAAHNGKAKREGIGDQVALMAFGATRMQDFPMQQGDAAEASQAEPCWRALLTRVPRRARGSSLPCGVYHQLQKGRGAGSTGNPRQGKGLLYAP